MLTITPYQVSELGRLMVDGHIDGRPPSSVSLEVKAGYLIVHTAKWSRSFQRIGEHVQGDSPTQAAGHNRWVYEAVGQPSTWCWPTAPIDRPADSGSAAAGWRAPPEINPGDDPKPPQGDQSHDHHRCSQPQARPLRKRRAANPPPSSSGENASRAQHAVLRPHQGTADRL